MLLNLNAILLFGISIIMEYIEDCKQKICSGISSKITGPIMKISHELNLQTNKFAACFPLEVADLLGISG